MEIKETIQEKLDKITRFEVINHAKNNYSVGRVVTLYKKVEGCSFETIKLDFQDSGRTLKIFISGN